MKEAKLWYVVADGGRARFVERDENGAFRTILSFVSADLHEKSSDLGKDRPVRVQDSVGPARHAVEPRRDLHQAAKADFIREVADQLDAKQKQGRFDELVLVAPPGVLTQLKDRLSKTVANTVVRDLQKDLTNVRDHELTAHLDPGR